MTSFDKSAVDVAELSKAELERIVEALLGKSPESTWKLSNGGCAANYGVQVGTTRGVIKAVVGTESQVLAGNQLRVLKLLDGSVAPKALSPRTIACTTTTGIDACAVAMELVDGEAANVAVQRGAEPVTAYGAIGTTLGRLHKRQFPVSGVDNQLNDPRYLEMFVRIDTSLEDAIPEGDFAAWLRQRDRLQRTRRTLARSDLPRGLLHGDPYADNHVIVWDPERGVTSGTLVDWEDVTVGPLAYDLACALVACAFDVSQDNVAVLNNAVAAAVLRNYAAERDDFSTNEATALMDLMLANVLACATYRWYQFNVVDPDSSPAAKASYREMLAIASAIEDSEAGQTIRDLASGVA